MSKSIGSKRLGSERVSVAYLARPKGIHGWVVAEPLTHDPQRIGDLTDVVLEANRGPSQEEHIEAWRPEGRSVLLKFTGIDSPEAVREKLVKRYVTITKDHVAPLPQGQHYIFDLIGCQIVDTDDTELGSVTDVLPMPSADVIVVRRAGGDEALIPMVGDFVKEIDTAAREIRVRGVEELFEDQCPVKESPR